MRSHQNREKRESGVEKNHGVIGTIHLLSILDKLVGSTESMGRDIYLEALDGGTGSVVGVGRVGVARKNQIK